jgi:hypothetical protein
VHKQLEQQTPSLGDMAEDDGHLGASHRPNFPAAALDVSIGELAKRS